MIGVKLRRSGSWLDPQCSGILGWQLGKRLWSRVQGRPGCFITLTYKRDKYEDSRDLYRTQAEEQHVPLFMRRLARVLGVKSLKGRWLCKMEFQEGGWVHWHIVLLGPTFIDHAALTRAWGHGHVLIKRLTKKRVFYTCKYVAKGGDDKLPMWIYGEAPRSVKIVRVSPGFWGDTSEPRAKSPPCRGGYLVGCYVPIGVKLRQRGVLVRTDHGKVISVKCEPIEFFQRLERRAMRLGVRGGWHFYQCGMYVVEAVKAACEAASEGERPQASPSAAREAGKPGLYLRGTSNPDAWVDWLPWWMEAHYRQEAMAL